MEYYITNTKMKGRYVQFLAMISGAILPFTNGINFGWTSPYMSLLQDPNRSPILLTSSEASWLAVMYLIGSPVGSFMAAYLVDKFGRKNVLLLQAPIITTSFLFIAFARNKVLLYCARFLLGTTEGAIYTALPIYFGEIAEPKIRGILGSSITFSSLLGCLFVNIIGPLFDIRSSGVIFSVIPLVHVASFWRIPESPYYLLKVGNVEGAKASLLKFRGGEDVNGELNELKDAVRRQESFKMGSFMDLIKVRSYRKGMIIYSIVAGANQLSGKSPVILYTTSIFTTAGGNITAETSVIIFSGMAIIATGVALLIVDRVGRRPMLMFSSLGCAVALATQAAYFSLQVFNPEYLENLNWVPITALLLYNVILNLGLSFGPVLLLTELFPTSIKGKALGVAETVSVIYAILASKFFHVASDIFGMYVPFWTFAIFAWIGGVLIYMFVPETKGKTLEKIQLELIKQN